MDFLGNLLRVFGHNLGLPPQYHFVRRLGKGTEGDVWLATDSERNAMVAVKLVPRGPPLWRLDMVGREGRMLSRLGVGHINIVRPLEVALTTKHLAFISEFCAGGSMSDYLAKHKMSEEVARYFFRQLLDAISHCHKHKVAYRDIKPGNCLITGTNPPFMKLCDFGLANNWSGRVPEFQTLAGTPGYMPPEIMSGFFAPDKALAEPYDGVKADVYSAGVMLVVMLLHTMPWHYDTYAARLPPLEAMKQLYQLESIQGVGWREATSKVTKLSLPLAALLDTMLEPDKDNRASLEQVAASEWVNLPLPATLQAALDVLKEQQAAREAAAVAMLGSADGGGTGSESSAAGPGLTTGLPDAEISHRLAEFDEMMKAAASVGKGWKLERRLLLAVINTRQQHRPSQQEGAQQQGEQQ